MARGPRLSGSEPPVKLQARQEGTRAGRGRPVEPAERSGRLCHEEEEERLNAPRTRPATGPGQSVIHPGYRACRCPAAGHARCGLLLEDECGAKPGYLEDLP